MYVVEPTSLLNKSSFFPLQNISFIFLYISTVYTHKSHCSQLIIKLLFVSYSERVRRGTNSQLVKQINILCLTSW
uniref:Uncharacterized protein n=1 Tax=Helianthus annuus TaxID=4232 RepID=A0A251TXC0_HELAN